MLKEHLPYFILANTSYFWYWALIVIISSGFHKIKNYKHLHIVSLSEALSVNARIAYGENHEKNCPGPVVSDNHNRL